MNSVPLAMNSVPLAMNSVPLAMFDHRQLKLHLTQQATSDATVALSGSAAMPQCRQHHLHPEADGSCCPATRAKPRSKALQAYSDFKRNTAKRNMTKGKEVDVCTQEELPRVSTYARKL